MWKKDESGLSSYEQGVHRWILPRPSYCDRGHWSIGQLGAVEHAPLPSYYFMDKASAGIEMDLWIAANSSEKIISRPDFIEDEMLIRGWLPHPDKKSFILYRGKKNITLERVSFEKEDLYVLSAGNLDFIDDADQFPRLFRDKDIAVTEAEQFLAWRLSGPAPSQKPKP